MSSPSNSTVFSSSLRQLSWPAWPPVDLLNECRWLITLDARETNSKHFRLQSETFTKKLPEKPKSPFHQQLSRSKPLAPSVGSPAQRAAKSILKLKENLLRLDGTKLETHDEPATITVLDQQTSDSKSRFIHFNVKDKRAGIGSSKASLNIDKTPARSPSRKKKRPLTSEERDLVEKQIRLADWLKVNSEADPANTIENGYRDDGIMTPLYSSEVCSRIKSAMQCRGPLESGVRLWDDPVRSMLAVEMTSESVFGGAVPTRALTFQSPQTSPEKKGERSPHKHLQAEEINIVEAAMTDESPDDIPAIRVKPELSDHARNVFNVAHRQVVNGAVVDALATLQDGIRQSLSTSQAHLDAVSSSNGLGFNYSELAHKSATKLQLCYRSRHRQRIDRLIFLQRQWRWYHARRRLLSSVQFAGKQAMIIQRNYRPWYKHITRVRSAALIQCCFRVFQSQKVVIRFRQVGRLLLARQAQRWRLKTRIRMIGKWVLHYRRRRRRIALVQGLWRCRCARAQLRIRLARVRAEEKQRRAREEEFVTIRLEKARLHFRDFLTTTKRGRELVRWQTQKPWLRFRRLRDDPEQWEKLPVSEKIDTVARVLHGRRFRGLHQRALCQMLVGSNEQLPALPKVLKVSVEELSLLAAPITVSESLVNEKLGCACCPLWASISEKLKHTRSKLSHHAATLCWSLVTYPKEYLAAHFWPLQQLRRDQARKQLEDDCVRVIAAFLRVQFRSIDKTNVPSYSCGWCSEPFSTSAEYFTHKKCLVSRALAEAEWSALSKDLKYLQRNKWRKALKLPTRPDTHAFELKTPSVRRFKGTRSRDIALRSLVAILEVCTATDSPESAISLDLAGFVLQYLEEDRDSHPLMQTAEYQLGRWSTLIGSVAVESSHSDKRWICKDELYSRLFVGCKGRISFIDRNVLSLKPMGSCVSDPLTRFESALQRQIQRLIRRMRDQNPVQTTVKTSSVAGSRVLPIAT